MKCGKCGQDITTRHNPKCATFQEHLQKTISDMNAHAEVCPDDPDDGEGKGDGTDRDEPGTDR